MKSSTKSRASKARSAKSSSRKKASRGPLAREKAELDRTLYFLDHYLAAAKEAGRAGDKIRNLVKQQAEESRPIRVRFAGSLLDVSDHTVVDWCRRGILVERETHPRRVSLESVLKAKNILDEIRAAGRSRDLTSAILNKLELDELKGDQRFRTSLAQAKRGERGEWPAGF